MGIQINGQTDTVSSTTSGGSVKVTPLSASTGLNVGTGASISSPATNVLTLGTNNVESVRITSSGNVGINSTAPRSALDVGGVITLGRNDSSQEGGEIAFCRSTDNASSWSVDVYGNTSTPSLRFIDNIAAATRMSIDGSGGVGIGLTNPDEILCVSKSSPDPYNTVTTHLKLINSAGNSGAGNRIQFVSGAATAWIQSLVSGANSASGCDLVFGTPASGTVGTERVRITSSADFNITQTPGRYTVDTSPGATSIANGGTVDFANASGMLVANNWTNGNVTIYICGGGTVTAVANTGINVGSFAYNAGIAGYRWTNNYGSTAVFGFFFVRTRTTA